MVKLSTRLRLRIEIEEDWKIGNKFDVVLSKKSNSRGAAASISKYGEIILFPNWLWKEASLKNIIEVISHECEHILIAQTDGVFASNSYDNISEHEIPVKFL